MDFPLRLPKRVFKMQDIIVGYLLEQALRRERAGDALKYCLCRKLGFITKLVNNSVPEICAIQRQLQVICLSV